MDKFNPQQKEVMDNLVLDMPGVKGGKAFGCPAYKINGKVFAFVRSPGIALKLPTERVNELLDSSTMQPFEVADGIIWKAWVMIQRADPDDYRDDLPLIEESAAFVAGKA